MNRTESFWVATRRITILLMDRNWQEYEESNPGSRVWNPLHYHYTILLYLVREEGLEPPTFRVTTERSTN